MCLKISFSYNIHPPIYYTDMIPSLVLSRNCINKLVTSIDCSASLRSSCVSTPLSFSLKAVSNALAKTSCKDSLPGISDYTSSVILIGNPYILQFCYTDYLFFIHAACTNLNSKSLRSFSRSVLRITPETNMSKATTITMPQTISVGNRATSPVLK